MKKNVTENAYLLVKIMFEFLCTFFIIYFSITQILDLEDNLGENYDFTWLIGKVIFFFAISICYSFMQRHWLITLAINDILPTDFVGIPGNDTTDEQTEHYTSELAQLHPFKAEYTVFALAITILSINSNSGLLSAVVEAILCLIFIGISIVLICSVVYHLVYKEIIEAMDHYYEMQQETYEERKEPIDIMTEEGYNEALQSISEIVSARMSEGLIDTSDWEDADWDEAEAAKIVQAREGEPSTAQKSESQSQKSSEYFITVVLARNATEDEAVESFRKIFKGVQNGTK